MPRLEAGVAENLAASFHGDPGGTRSQSNAQTAHAPQHGNIQGWGWVATIRLLFYSNFSKTLLFMVGISKMLSSLFCVKFNFLTIIITKILQYFYNIE